MDFAAYFITLRGLTPSQEEDASAIAHEKGSTGVLSEDSFLCVYFPTENECRDYLSHLPVEWNLSGSTIEGVISEDWMAGWRETAKPVQLAGEFWAVPPWHHDVASNKQIVIDPQMAFGTGHHASTQLAAEAMLYIHQNIFKAERMLEVGAGSGILCYLGQLLAIPKILGLEIDKGTAKNIAANHVSNGFSHQHIVAIGSTAVLKPTHFFDLLVINEIRTHVEKFLDASLKTLMPSGYFIWSGTLKREWPLVKQFAGVRGLVVVKTFEKEDWIATLFKLHRNG